MLMRSNLAEQLPSSPDNAIPQRESGVGLIADRKRREAQKPTSLDALGDEVIAKRERRTDLDALGDEVVAKKARKKVVMPDLGETIELMRSVNRSDAHVGESRIAEHAIDVTSDAALQLEDDDIEILAGPPAAADAGDLRRARDLRKAVEDEAKRRPARKALDQELASANQELLSSQSRKKADKNKFDRDTQESALGREIASAERDFDATVDASRAYEADDRAELVRQAARVEGERLVEARQRGYEGFVTRDAEGRVIGLRSDLEEIPIDFAFQATAEGFNRLTAEVKETRSLPAEMAKNRLAQIQEETDRWNKQYQDTERVMAFHAKPEAGEISVTYEEGDIRDEVSANPDLMVPNAFYEAPQEPEAVVAERPMAKEDRIEAKKAEVRAEIAMIESQLDASNVDIREHRLREDMAVAEAKIETLKGELKMLKKASPEERAKMKEDIQVQEGHLRILHEELKAWKKDEDRPKEVRARKQALIGKLQALKDELEDLDSFDVDLTELNAAAKEDEIPVDVDLSGMEEDVDLSEVEEGAAARRGKKKAA